MCRGSSCETLGMAKGGKHQADEKVGNRKKTGKGGCYAAEDLWDIESLYRFFTLAYNTVTINLRCTHLN